MCITCFHNALIHALGASYLTSSVTPASIGPCNSSSDLMCIATAIIVVEFFTSGALFGLKTKNSLNIVNLINLFLLVMRSPFETVL